ncbi:uncharacterized protein TNCV_1692441 [Trichonephila clavipes]|nr:uncharacterized protein TNCV_1692441 [Trichonephila clavipes]
MDHVILNHGQVTWTTPELAPPLLTTTPHQREDVSALDRFNVHRCPTRRVFSGTGLELVTKQATPYIRILTPLETNRLRELMHVNSIRALSLVWDGGEKRGLPAQLVNIKVALFSCTRAFADGPRHFETWSSDEDDT